MEKTHKLLIIDIDSLDVLKYINNSSSEFWYVRLNSSFIRQVQDDGMWSLKNNLETKIVNAKELLNKIVECQMDTGLPFILNKDYT